MIKILITGATGNVGTQLVKLLIAAKANLRVLLQKPNAEAEMNFRDNNVEVAYGTFDDQASLTKAMTGIEKVFLLLPSHPNMVAYANNAIEAAKAAGVKHIVKQSVLGADKNAGVDIPRFHGVTDEALKNSGIKYTILQPNSFLQNFIGFASIIKDHGRFYANYADGKFSTVDVRDIAAAGS